MYKKLSLVAAAAVAVVALAGVGSASAATLYTSSAHTIPVSVGTTFTASTAKTTDFTAYRIFNGTAWLDGCNSASYTFKVTQNSGGTFKAAVIGGAQTGCAPFTFTVLPTGELTVTGSSIAVGTNRAWEGTTLTNSETLAGGTSSANFGGASGNPPANGTFTQQPAGGSPVSIGQSNAGTLTGNVVGNARVTATYTLAGSAGGYSFN